MKSTIKYLTVSIFVLSLLLLSGCNTMKGLGEDMESLGESIQNKAD